MNLWHECLKKEQPNKCSIQHQWVEGLEALPELNGEIALKILLGPTLASQQSIYPLSQRIEMLRCSSSSSCPRDPLTISESRKICKLRYLRNVLEQKKFPKKTCLFAHNRTIMLPKYWGGHLFFGPPKQNLWGVSDPASPGIYAYDAVN